MDYAITSLQSDGRVLLESGDSTSSISGLQELIQQVLIELLSDYNEITDRGTDMVIQLNDAAFADDSDLRGIVTQATALAQAHIIELQRDMTLSNYARLANIEYIGGSIGNGTYSIELRVTNLAGQSASVAIP